MALRKILTGSTIVGNERIEFQKQSKLYVELIRIMQKGIDATEKYHLDNNYSSLEPGVIKGFAAAIYKAVNEPVRDSVFRHLGIKLRKFSINDGPVGAFPNAYCLTMFQPLLLVNKNAFKLFNLRSVMSHGGSDGSQQHMEIIKNAEGKIDYRVGRFDPSINKAFSWDVCLHAGLFMMGRTNSDPKGIADNFYTRTKFTAEELAAILLHELGHGFYLVADAVISVKKSDTLADLYLNNVKKAFNKEPLTVDKDVPKATAVGFISLIQLVTEKVLTAVSTAVSMSYLKDIARCSDLTDLKGSVNKIGNKSTMKLLAVAIFLLIVLPMIFKLMFSGNHIEDALAAIEGQRKKRSETMITGRDGQRIEEIADSFAIRHGAAAALSTGLSKLYPQLQEKNITKVKQDANNLTSVTGMLATIASYVDLTDDIEPMKAASTYPETINRFQFVLNEQIRILKTMDRTPETTEAIDQVVHAIKVIKDIQRQVETDPAFKEMRTMNTALGAENTRGTLIGSIFTGNTNEDYRRLTDALNAMSANDSYFQAEDFMSKK